MIGKATPGRIFTFYSYKGGTGRSMLVANTAWLLAGAGYHVLMVDWDLEAPGLHRYMAPFLTDPQMTDSNGLIDLVVSYATEAVEPSESPRPKEWYRDKADVLDYAVSVNWKFETGGSLSLLPAGRQGAAYATKVNSFSWQNFYDRLGGYGFFEALKDSMRANFDFVLIDSRTGVSDTAGICTVQFPDSLVVCFTLNNQSIEGAAAVARSVKEQKQSDNFRIFPIPTRLDNSESEKLLDRWKLAKDRFEKLLPANQGSRYWDDFAILYVPKFAYEEILAVFGNRPDDPANLNILSHAKRLTEALAEVPVPLTPIDESIRSNVLAHFAGRSVTLSPMEAQHKADEDRARAEEAQKQLEIEKAKAIADAWAEGKQEVTEVLAATVRKARQQRIAAIVGLFLLIALVVGYRLYSQHRVSVAQDAVRAGDQAAVQMNWDKALEQYSEALEVITDDASLYGKRANALSQLEKPAEALKDFDKAVALEPDDLELRTARGQNRMSAHDFKGAIEDLSHAAGRNSTDPAAFRLLAVAYQQNDQPKEAIDIYSKLVDQFPDQDDQQELLNRANLYVKVDDKLSAIKDFRRVAEAIPNSPSAVFAQEQLKVLGADPVPIKPPAPAHRVVFIQYSDGAGEKLLAALRAALQKAGFEAPDGESKPPQSSKGEVRYFHRADSANAKRVKEVVELELAKQRYLLSLAPQLLEKLPAPVGQLEVWLPPLAGSQDTPRNYDMPPTGKK